MNGVEILNETQVVAEAAFNWSAFWITFCVLLGIFITAGVVLSIAEGPDLVGWLLVVVAGILLGSLFGFILGMWTESPISYETRYQVIIDDSVLMDDFLDKYEILDTEGKILTVRERTR